MIYETFVQILNVLVFNSGRFLIFLFQRPKAAQLIYIKLQQMLSLEPTLGALEGQEESHEGQSGPHDAAHFPGCAMEAHFPLEHLINLPFLPSAPSHKKSYVVSLRVFSEAEAKVIFFLGRG
jgi:hypothetical protein